jgi:hypothetical protein
LAQFNGLTLDVSLYKAVLVLCGDESCPPALVAHPKRFHQLQCYKIRYTDVADFAIPYQVIE